MVVLTGGEPSLQADAPLIDTFHQHGFTVAMESNGTHLPPINIDWLTISPKAHTVVTHCNELKCIFDEQGRVEVPANITADHYFLQPCDVGDPVRNARITAACVNYIKQHPRWRLSLQTHKLINIP
jgi:organic radical activating enzyme